MTKDTKGVRQVLDTFYSRRKQEWDKLDLGMINKDIFKSNCSVVMDEAETKLQEIMLGMLPEKIKLGKAVYKNVGDGYASERIGYKHGFNDALADMEQNIRGGFNNG